MQNGAPVDAAQPECEEASESSGGGGGGGGKRPRYIIRGRGARGDYDSMTSRDVG